MKKNKLMSETMKNGMANTLSHIAHFFEYILLSENMATATPTTLKINISQKYKRVGKYFEVLGIFEEHHFHF